MKAMPSLDALLVAPESKALTRDFVFHLNGQCSLAPWHPGTLLLTRQRSPGVGAGQVCVNLRQRVISLQKTEGITRSTRSWQRCWKMP
eukprot:3146575-Rhodomonas_salina.1